MQDYVKIIFLKRLVKVICDKKEVSYQQLQELTGLPEEYLDNLLLMLGNYVEELELPDEGLCYKATDDTYMLLTVEEDFWKTLPGFDRLKMFEKEIKILTKEDPLLFLAKTVSKVHKGDKKLIVLAILSAISPWVGSEIIHLYPVGRSGKGKSIVKDTLVYVLGKEGPELVRIDKAFESKFNATVSVTKDFVPVISKIRKASKHWYKGKIIKVITRSGRIIKATPDHSFLVYRDGKIVPESGDKIKIGDMLPCIKKIQFPTKIKEKDGLKLDELCGFVVGMYLAEGGAGNIAIQITNSQKSAVDKIKNWLNRFGVKLSRYYKKRLVYGKIRQANTYSFTKSKLYKFFKTNFGTGAKNKKIPGWVYFAPLEFKKGLLNGYFSGDGALTAQLEFTTKSKKLAYGIMLLLSEFGIFCSTRTKIVKGKKYYVQRIERPISVKLFYDNIGFTRDDLNKVKKFKKMAELNFKMRTNNRSYYDKIPVEIEKFLDMCKSYHLSKRNTKTRIIIDGLRSELKRSLKYGKPACISRSNLKDKLKQLVSICPDLQEHPYYKLLNKLINANILWDKVVKVEHEYYEDYVYDFDTEEENFLLGNGIFVHNSDLCSSTLHILPSWAKETISSTSPLAPYYAIKRGLLDDNKVLYFDDVKSNPVFIEVVKTFAGGMKVRPRHWTVDERRRFIDIKPEHKYSIWLTSVNPITDEQLKNRFVLANVDESIEQDKRVWKYLDEIYRKAKEKSIIEDPDFQTAQNVVNILIQEPAQVIVPFKVQFPILFDRRSYIYFIVAVKVAAFIRKFQRKVIDGKIIATRQDFEIARKIWQEIGRYQFLKIDADSYRILSVLGVGPENGLTYSEIMEKIREKYGISISRQKIARRCQKDLAEMNLVSGEKIGSWRWWINEDLSVAIDLSNIKSFEATKEDLEEFGIKPTEENLKYVNEVKETELLKFMEMIEDGEED